MQRDVTFDFLWRLFGYSVRSVGARKWMPRTQNSKGHVSYIGIKVWTNLTQYSVINVSSPHSNRARAWMLLTEHFSNVFKVCALLSAIMMTECGKISWRMLSFCDFHPKSTWTKILRIFFQRTWSWDYDGGGGFREGGGGGRKSCK